MVFCQGADVDINSMDVGNGTFVLPATGCAMFQVSGNMQANVGLPAGLEPCIGGTVSGSQAAAWIASNACNSCAPLPVKLLASTARRLDAARVELLATLAEVPRNPVRVEVYRGMAVAALELTGITLEAHNQTDLALVDYLPTALQGQPVLYYQLQFTDLNGESRRGPVLEVLDAPQSLMSPITAHLTGSGNLAVVHPTPTLPGEVVYTILDALGRQVYQTQLPPPSAGAVTSQTLALPVLPSGVYSLSARAPGFAAAVRFMLGYEY